LEEIFTLHLRSYTEFSIHSTYHVTRKYFKELNDIGGTEDGSYTIKKKKNPEGTASLNVCG